MMFRAWIKSGLALVVLGALAVAPLARPQTVDGKPTTKTEVLDKVTELITKDAFVPGVDFTKFPDYLISEKARLDAAKSDDEFARAVNQALEKFGASHTVLITPQSSEAQRTQSAVGIGITSQLNPDGSVVVVRAIGDAPAAMAGIVPGDVITEVDGKKAEGIKGIRGPEGTVVHLKVKKLDGREVDYAITRKKFSTARPEELTFLDHDTAMISIYTFNLAYDRDRVEQLMLKAASAKNLIVDLRDNPGGAVSNLQHFLGLLIPDQRAVGTFISKRTLDRYVAATGGKPTDLIAVANWSKLKLTPFKNSIKPFDGNVVVLVNQFSGSAAEIAAAALRDAIGAEVIGTKSAGEVLVSVIVPAADGFMLQYPLSDYITIKGQRLEGTGVTPDIEVKDARPRLPFAPDDPVLRAMAFLGQATATTASTHPEKTNP